MTMHNLEVYKNVKVLEVKDDFFIGVKGYRLYKFYFDKNTYEYVGPVSYTHLTLPTNSRV